MDLELSLDDTSETIASLTRTFSPSMVKDSEVTFFQAHDGVMMPNHA